MWFVITLIVGGLLGLEMWTRSRGIKVTWYDRLIGAVGIVLLLFAIQNYFGSLAEWWPNAANFYLLVAGLPGLVLLAVAATLIWRRRAAG